MRPKVEFDLLEFKNNIIKIKAQTRGINFLFPVKCCNYPVVLDIVNDNGFGFDISNKNEFKIIEKYFKSIGCEYVFVDCFAYNEKGRLFYEKMGYHPRMITNIKKLNS